MIYENTVEIPLVMVRQHAETLLYLLPLNEAMNAIIADANYLCP